jgi:glucose-1-phosphate thymidylyltransferase/glucose-1-phosphate adenylyltransferase
MISVGKTGKSLMDYQLFNAHLAGFEEILLLLHPEDVFTQEYYEEQMSTDSTLGLNIQFSRQYISPDRQKPAGTADAVLQALQQQTSWQTGKLIIINSDNLYSSKALELLWDACSDNALISYDRDALEFPEERIKAFAVIRSDEKGYLQEIIEKPDDKIINQLMQQSGRIGVSMNAFVIVAEQMIPYLELTPFHPIRYEKELPTTISLMVTDFPDSFFTIPLAENVPDLTSKHDLAIVQNYLQANYSF